MPWLRARAWPESGRTRPATISIRAITKKQRKFASNNTYSLLLDLLILATLQSDQVALVLQALRGDEALNLGSLGVGLLALALGLDLPTNDVFPDIVLLGEAEELANLGGTLGAQALGVNDIGQAGNILLALLGNGQSQN